MSSFNKKKRTQRHIAVGFNFLKDFYTVDYFVGMLQQVSAIAHIISGCVKKISGLSVSFIALY